MQNLVWVKGGVVHGMIFHAGCCLEGGFETGGKTAVPATMTLMEALKQFLGGCDFDVASTGVWVRHYSFQKFS